MSTGAIELQGFETALIAHIAAGFRWSGEFLKNRPVEVDRHLFTQMLPDEERLAQVYGDPASTHPFEEGREPAVLVLTQPGSGLVQSSSRGGKHEWTLRFLLRLGTNFERAKSHLEELVEYIHSEMPLDFDPFSIGTVLIESRPRPGQRPSDDTAYSETVLRFLVVPTD